MDAILITPEVRPNRLDGTPKNEDYHVKYGRYCVSAGLNHPYQVDFMAANMVFWNFYKGNQWILNEDLAAFLTDESGDARNRIKVMENIIRPMVEQWIGNAIRMQFNAKAVNISPFAKNRRDERLAEMLLLTKVGNAMGGAVKEQIQKENGTGETEEETQQLFENYYIDCYTKAINNLLRWSKERNKFDNSIVEFAKFMGITGMAVHKGYERNGEQQWDVTDPSFFFWDRAARKNDLSDASFMAEYNYAAPSDLYESYQTLPQKAREAIENFTQKNTELYAPIANWQVVTKDRIFKVESYWKDCEKQQYGYVIDPYGYEMLTQINCDWNEYTDKDLVVPQTENYKKFIGKGKKKTIFVDVLRYCIFTPKEICGYIDENGMSRDIVYEYGKVPYQQTNTLDPSNVEFPYKVQIWEYHNGEVVSPIQDAISPQRMLNRALSATESMVNNARGSGTVIDKNAIDAQGGEDEIQRNIMLSKPIIVDSARTGVQNVVGQYGSNLGQNINPFMDYTQGMRGIVMNSIGVNESMQGTGGKASDLVGVQELRVQRGSLIQEKFYHRLSDVMLQTYNSVASQGKRIYADSKRRLAIIAGDEAAEEIIITKEMNLEDFHTFIERVSPDADQKQEAMSAALQLFQLGLLGDRQVAEVWNRGDLNDVAKLMRQFAQEKTMIQSAQQADQREQQAQMFQYQQNQERDAQAQQQQAMQIGLSEAEKKRQNDINKIVVKESFKTKHIQSQNQAKLLSAVINKNNKEEKKETNK